MEVCWVAVRFGESIPGCQRRHPEWRKNGALSKVAYLAWLLDERDGLSFDRVGERVFAKEHDESDSVEAGGKSAGEPDSRKMRAYRAWRRVEREFGRGPLRRKPKPLQLLAVSP